MVVVTINTSEKPLPSLVLPFLDKKSVSSPLAGYVFFFSFPSFLALAFLLKLSIIDWSATWYSQSQGGLNGTRRCLPFIFAYLPTYEKYALFSTRPLSCVCLPA
jgi:hypothetical protein